MSVDAWVRPLGGMWTPIGEAGYPRILASSVSLEADEWGPSQGALTLDLGPRLPIPAFLVQYASIYVEIDGARVWSGFISKLDRQDRLVNVSLQGSQMRLDDQPVRWAPLDDRFTSWSTDVAQANNWTTGQAQVSANSITFTYPTNIEDIMGCNAVTYMPGPGRLRGIALAFSTNMSAPNLRFGIFASDNPHDPQGNTSTPIPPFASQPCDGNTYTMLVTSVGFAALQYVSIGTYNPPASQLGVPAGFSCTVTAILAAERAVYINSSTLQPTVTGDLLATRIAAMVIGLNPDTRGIQPTPTLIPSFAYDTHTPTRTLLTDAAQYDDAIHKIDANDRLVFGPRPTGATVELGAGAPATSETPADPSTMVSAVQIDSQDASGNPVYRTVTLLDLPEMPRRLWPATINNPDFATNDLSSWTGDVNTNPATASSGTLPITPPPGYAGTANFAGVTNTLTLGGSLPAGVPVTMSWWALQKLGDLQPPYLNVYVIIRATDADNPSFSPVYATNFLNTVVGAPSNPQPPWPWKQYSISFVPRETWTSPTLTFLIEGGTINVWGTQWIAAVGSIFVTGFRVVSPGGPWTNINRTGSLTLSNASNDSQLVSLGQTYLRVNNRLGYSGQRDAPDGGARDATSHAPLPAASLLANTGTYARLADRVDPADGKIGAMAYISQVAYEHSSRRASVTVGQRYAVVDELMARFANPRPRFPARRK